MRNSLVISFLSLLVISAAADASQMAPSGWTLVYDFMVQDVCTNDAGSVISAMSPMDNGCRQHRNLLPGELLPYHKHDWPSEKDSRQREHGYQRSDSYPFVTKALGIVSVQTFDFGAGERAFGRLDAGDGGQVVAFSSQSASIIATEDGGRGLQLMANVKCSTGSVQPLSVLDSWLIVDKRGEEQRFGTAVAKLRIITNPVCPTDFDKAFTEWRFEEYRYRASLSGDLTNPLTTLVSSHFGGESLSNAHHMERFYFTREFGFTRWERWQNLKYSKDQERDVSRAEYMSSSGRCQKLGPAPDSGWVMVDCREWTNIISSDHDGGDIPDFWIGKLRNNPFTEPLFVR
jgi:hypothetical protein